MDKLRLRFEKTGRAVYISHLDLMHTMQRGFSRAGYELKYSEGYNPHPQISIALPLPVGTASLCEIMDFRLRQDVDLSALPQRMNQALPEGVRVLEAYEAQRKAAQIKYLSVEGLLEYDSRPLPEMVQGLEDFFRAESIPVTKKTKRGMGEVDIRPSIRELRFIAEEAGVAVSAVLSAQEPSLNPDMLVRALAERAPDLAPDFARFVRRETYDENMAVFR